MRRTTLILIALTVPAAASAGCVGPTIMGECKGQIVHWDTHPQGQSDTPPAAPGFYYDKRDTNAERQNPGSVNPFTGRDAHDADMNASDRQRCFERRDKLLQQGIFINCP